MVSVLPRQVGWPLIFISLRLKGKLWDSTYYLQTLYIWPLASLNDPPNIQSQLLPFLFGHQFLYFLCHLLIPVCFICLALFWNKYGSLSHNNNHLMTHTLQCAVHLDISISLIFHTKLLTASRVHLPSAGNKWCASVQLSERLIRHTWHFTAFYIFWVHQVQLTFFRWSFLPLTGQQGFLYCKCCIRLWNKLLI